MSCSGTQRVHKNS